MQRGHNNVQVFDYGLTHCEEKSTSNINDCIPYKDTDSVTWINIDSVPPISFLEELRLGFDLHPVIEDDILTLNQRPKVEVLDSYIFLRLKTVRYDAHVRRVRNEQVSIVVAPRFLLTFQQGVAGDTFENIRKFIREGEQRIRSGGTDYLCYELIDAMVDSFFGVLEHSSARIDQLEQDMARNTDPHSLRSLDALKRELLGLRKAAWPLREVITQLERANSSLIAEGTKIYLRDVHTKLIQVTESIDIYREMASSLQDFYHLRVNNRTNEVMKFLTVITTIFMPLTLLVGFYGMNFAGLPGVESPMGPLVLLGAMVTIAIGMLSYFKYRGWL